MNKVLKTAQHYLLLPITKLMNLIIESEKYPSSWCRNILVTSYKGGGNDDPDNYRGISIGSCLAKLYSTIFYHRILEVNDNVGLINNKQIGFLKGFRTADHLLVIDTIINEVVHKKKKKLFVAFIDLKKAYDKINRDALIFKLKRKGFSGKFLMSIVALVNNVLQIPKINGKLLPPIVTSTGLKQGDNLSPILFDIFFDDVELIFDSKCEPVVSSDELSLNHLLYADDMAILSLSSEGRQHSLDNLHEYHKVWYLDVSIKKPKVIVLIALEEYLNNFSLYMMASLLKWSRNSNTWEQLCHHLEASFLQKRS